MKSQSKPISIATNVKETATCSGRIHFLLLMGLCDDAKAVNASALVELYYVSKLWERKKQKSFKGREHEFNERQLFLEFFMSHASDDLCLLFLEVSGNAPMAQRR